MKRTIVISVLLVVIWATGIEAQTITSVVGESTPSKSQYFSWINNTNEGATAEHSLINFEFFRWLKEEYGMVLDIYAFDAGAIDGANFYGTMNSERFQKQFPDGFGQLANEAGKMGMRLGLWGGPDGFGNSPEEAEARKEMMVSLCRDFNFELFKMDAVCGQLRPEKFEIFDVMMTECRKYAPDLILLNHRLDLGPATKHSTTYLLGGAETYIDVHMANEVTAPHHRACALDRELPPGLTRLTEDHGVCLSSCLDYWEDDLILQAFNRNLILAPQIYANPWLLRDDEFPKLAFIYNLHRRYRDILVSGLELPEEIYGPSAASRGDENTRLITLRNLSWEPVTYKISIDEEIALESCRSAIVMQYHPVVKYLGEFEYDTEVCVTVQPFRSCLIKVVDSETINEMIIRGGPYEIIKDIPGAPMEIKLLGYPGEKANYILMNGNENFTKAMVGGMDVSDKILNEQELSVIFDGEPLRKAYHRKIAVLEVCEIPDDASSLYYATVFAADNNALEIRSLERSGPTMIPHVQNARDAFFNQETFSGREIWDDYLFDENLETAFSSSLMWGDQRLGNSSFCLDLGAVVQLDSITFRINDQYSLQPLKPGEGQTAWISEDLGAWDQITFLAGENMCFEPGEEQSFRYLRFNPAPLRIAEIQGYRLGESVSRDRWRASNLFKTYVEQHWWKPNEFKAAGSWKAEFQLEEIPDNSYLCVAINGIHGVEEAYAAFRIDGHYVGCPDRSPSFPSNAWEVPPRKTDKNYTYYLPLEKEMKGKKIEAIVLGFNPEKLDLSPEVYISAYPVPYREKLLKLIRRE